MLWCILAIGQAHAQEVPGDLQRPAPQPPVEGQAHLQGVYLDDSFEANELIGEVREAVHRKDWGQAVVKVQRLLQEFERKIISWDDGIYISIRDFINREVAAWPAEGLVAYRGYFEPIARGAFDEAIQGRDAVALADTFERYFCTATAIRAGDTLAQIHIEQGHFAPAQAIYERLLAAHPDADINNLEWQSRLAVCLALAGKGDAASELLLRAGRPLEQHLINWKGRHEPCASVIAEIEGNPVSVAVPAATTEWPMFGGDGTRNLLPQMGALPTAPLWTFDGFTPSTLARAEGYFQSSSYRSAYDSGKFLALQPIVTDGMVILSDALRVWARHRETGAEAWSYEGISPMSPDGGWGDRAVPPLHGCAALNGRVYVELGSRPVSYYGYQPPEIQSMLVCLDAATGTRIWQHSPQDFGEDPREVQFEGPLLVDDEGIYAIVRRRKPFGFEDCYLWKFNEAGGLIWRTHLSSASTGGFGYRRPTLTIPTLIDGTVYVQTNLGTVAAVDALSGVVDWIRVYERQEVNLDDRWQRSSADRTYPWHYSPILHFADRNLLVALPLDVDDLILLDARTGEVEFRAPRSDLFHVETILGILGGKLYGVGEQAFAWDIATHKISWSRPLGNESLYGRAALSQSHVFVPSRAGLSAFALDGGNPAFMQWDPTEEGGNVVLLSNEILIAGNSRITAYGLREDVFARLQAEIDRRPADPWPVLRLAEVAYRTAATHAPGGAKTADYQRGLQALREAVRRGGGFASALEPTLKERLFEHCILFARFHLNEQPPDTSAAIELLTMAGQCPPNAEATLRQKDRLAGTYALKNDYTNVIRQYHQIMLDRSLHELPWPGPDSEGQPAKRVCRRRIAEIIMEYGRAPYQPFDDKAATWLVTATQAIDVKKLDQLIEAMPNALAAPQALIAKGRILRDQRGEPLLAARAFYAALTRYPSQRDPADTMRQLADCYVLADKPALAYQWLTRAARRFPTARLEYLGRQITFSEYRDKLPSIHANSSPKQPIIRACARAAFSLPHDGELEMLRARSPADGKTDWSRALVFDHGVVRALDPTTGGEMWPAPLEVRQQPALLAGRKDVIVLTTQYEILGVGPSNGEILWRHGQFPATIDEPDTDPESFPAWRMHRLQNDRLISIRDDAHIVCLDVVSGKVIWQRDLKHGVAHSMSASEELIIYCAHQEETQVCTVLSAENGEPQRSIEISPDRPILDIILTYAGNAVLVTAQSLIAVDPLRGKVEWQVEFADNLQLDTIHVVLDGIVLATGGENILKLNVDDGERMWQSDALHRRPTEMDLLVNDSYIYAVTSETVHSVDLLSGRTLGQIRLPPDLILVHVQRTDQHLLLICRSLDGEEETVDFSAYFAPLPIQVDRLLEPQQLEPLGRFAKRIDFGCYDHAILGVLENALQGWVDASN